MKMHQRILAIVVSLLLLTLPARAIEQSSIVTPTSGPMSMATFAGTYLNPALRAIQSCNWGTAAPANGPSSLPIVYECWADTTTNPVVFKRYDGASWVVWGKLDASTHAWTPSFQGTYQSSMSTATTSANVASVISDETGSGALVFGTSPLITTPTINLGSDATGDVYYRNSGGAFTRLPIGSNGQALTVSSGLPAWAAVGGTGTVTTITAGADITLSSGATCTTTCTVNVGSGVTRTIASGTSALGTSAISSAACATVVTTSATGVATTDVVTAGFNGDPTGVTGYVPATTGMLTILSYPTANNVNFKVCNNTGSSITPGAITLNWRVVR